MIKVVLKQLRSRKQLREIECQKVVSASFEDEKEKYFTITFQSDDGKIIKHIQKAIYRIFQLIFYDILVVLYMRVQEWI